MPEGRVHRHGVSSRTATFLASLAVYLLGSGPILATAFWLREATGWNGFYAALWLYAPLWFIGLFEPDDWVSEYIEWWVNLLLTVARRMNLGYR